MATVINGTTGIDKVQDGSVTSSKIVDGTIASGDMADGAVTLSKMADGAITLSKMAAGVIPTGAAKASSNPLITTNGSIGDQWINTTTGEMFILKDATTNENIWTGQSGSEVNPVVDIDFDIITYTGDGVNPRTLPVGFQPDFIWIKERGTSQHHALFDSVRGFGQAKGLDTCHNTVEGGESNSYGYVSGTTSTGFTVGHSGGTYGDAHTNRSGHSFVAWCWELPIDNAGATSGGNGPARTYTNKSNGWMSISTFQGNVSTQHGIPHHLDAAPEFLWVKHLTNTGNHQAYNVTAGNDKVWNINSVQPPWVSSTRWDNTTPTLTHVILAHDWEVNDNNQNYVMYSFTSVANKCKVGSYIGTGATGNFINTGFEPMFIMIRRVNGSGHMPIHDTVRDDKTNNDARLWMSNTDAEQADADFKMTIQSNGFTIENTANHSDHNHDNASGDTYMYVAIAKQF
jgi:hypothetical protein